MAKSTFKVTCSSKSAVGKTSTVRFTVGETTAPAATPGAAPQRVAKQVFNFQFDDNKAADKFEMEKDYTITIE